MSLKKEIQNKIDKLNLINNLYTIVGNDPFWFDDVKDITSPQMLRVLREYGVINHTSITKTSFICINEYADIYKKVTANQWQFCGMLEVNRGYASIIANLQDDIYVLEYRKQELLREVQEQQQLIMEAQQKINQLHL